MRVPSCVRWMMLALFQHRHPATSCTSGAHVDGTAGERRTVARGGACEPGPPADVRRGCACVSPSPTRAALLRDSAVHNPVWTCIVRRAYDGCAPRRRGRTCTPVHREQVRRTVPLQRGERVWKICTRRLRRLRTANSPVARSSRGSAGLPSSRRRPPAWAASDRRWPTRPGSLHPTRRCPTIPPATKAKRRTPMHAAATTARRAACSKGTCATESSWRSSRARFPDVPTMPTPACAAWPTSSASRTRTCASCIP